MKKAYIPQPLNTQDIHLSDDLESLVELMAQNVHEEWAALRIRQGWTYGTYRDDNQKKHPCLVPYEELTEEEREYDRQTSLSTLKFILKMGFRITKGFTDLKSYGN